MSQVFKTADETSRLGEPLQVKCRQTNLRYCSNVYKFYVYCTNNLKIKKKTNKSLFILVTFWHKFISHKICCKSASSKTYGQY